MAYLSTLSDLDPLLANVGVGSGQFYMPKILFEYDDFKELEWKEILLYSLLLDRLKEPLDFIQKGYDDNGNIYVHFKIKDLCELLNQSKTTVISLKKKLVQFGLIEEVKTGNNQPNRIYITDKLVPYIKETFYIKSQEEILKNKKTPSLR